LRRSLRRYAWLLKLLLTLLVIVGVAWRLRGDFRDFSAADIRVSFWRLAASTGIFSVYLIASALIWHLLTRLNGVSIGAAQAVAVHLTSVLGKYVPGKVLLWGIRIFLYRRYRPDASVPALFRCCFIEYVGGLATAFALVAATLLVVDLSFITTPMRIGVLIALALSLGALHPIFLNGLAGRLARRIGLQESLVTIRERHVLAACLMQLANWFVLGLAVFVLAQGVCALGWNHFFLVTAGYTFAGVVGFLAFFAPSGIGVREAVLIGVLGQVMPVSDAAITALAARLASTLGEFVLAGGAWVSSETIRRTGVLRPRRGGLETGAEPAAEGTSPSSWRARI
jgi:hypothetical protein